MLPTSDLTTSTTPMAPGIYQIRCIPSGKVYIGSALNLRKRWKQHRGHLNRGTHHSRHLQAAWRKHGSNSFVFEILELIASPDDLVPTEQEYLDRVRPFDRRMGYNISPTAGSQLGVRFTPEVRAKLSDSRRGKPHPLSPGGRASIAEARRKGRTPEWRAKVAEANRRKARDPEYRAKMSAAHKGKKLSPEHAAKLAASRRGKPGHPSPMKGKKRPPEVVARISKTLKGRVFSPEHRANISKANKGRKQPREAVEKTAAANRGRKCGPDVLAKMSAATTRRYEDPEYRANHKEAIRNAMADPEVRAKVSEAAKKREERKRQRRQLERELILISA